MQNVTIAMKGVVKGLDRAMAAMNLAQVHDHELVHSRAFVCTSCLVPILICSNSRTLLFSYIPNGFRSVWQSFGSRFVVPHRPTIPTATTMHIHTHTTTTTLGDGPLGQI